MNKEIQEILNILNQNNHEAFIIGGFVRDYLLNKPSFDIDICTNINKDKLSEIFNINHGIYGEIHFTKNNYNYTITPYRKEIRYLNHKLIEFEFTNTLDLERRDFTINTICMDKNSNIIDKYNGIKDLKEKIIKTVGNPNEKIEEDSLRILRAIRFACVLDFNIDEYLENAIIKHKDLLNILSGFRIKEEIDKILSSNNCLKGLNLLKKYNILSNIGLDFDNITYNENIYYLYAQLKITNNLPFTKKEKKTILDFRHILNIKYNDFLERK